MRAATSPPRLITLVLLVALSTMTLNMFLPSLANIAAEFETRYAIASLALGGYLGVTTVFLLIVGPMADRFGRRPVLLAALAVFIAASLICANASSIEVFLIARIAQGGVIAGFALSLAIVRDTHEKDQAASLIGYISMAMAVAPMLGPVLGGVLDANFGWRSSFWVYASAGVIMWVIAWIDLGETRPEDAGGGASMVAGMGALLATPAFLAFSLCTVFSTGAFYIFLTGAPLVAGGQFGISTASLGLYIGSITAGYMLGGFITGRMAQHVGVMRMMMAGRVVGCSGPLIGMGLIAAGLITPFLFFAATILVGIGNGLTAPSANAAAISVRPELAGSASGLVGAMVVAVGAVLTSATGVILPAQAPAMTLLILMLGATFAAFLCVIWAWRLERGGAQGA